MYTAIYYGCAASRVASFTGSDCTIDIVDFGGLRIVNTGRISVFGLHEKADLIELCTAN